MRKKVAIGVIAGGGVVVDELVQANETFFREVGVLRVSFDEVLGFLAVAT